MRQQDVIARFALDGVKLELFWDGKMIGHKSDIDFELSYKGQIIYINSLQTPDYPDSIETVISALGFLTVRPGDTDPDYFKDHSPAMLQWLDTPIAEEIRMYINDIEGDEEAEKEHAKKILNRATEINPID